MKVKLNKQKHGFTIIEVMIVLAIAGLILAVVLLAVPALERSQRNNGRTSDATHLAGLVSDYTSNHGGVVPGVAANCNAIYGATENWSQLTGCSIQKQGTANVSTTFFVVDTSVTCTNGALANSTNANSFAIAWQPETTAAAYTTCVQGG